MMECNILGSGARRSLFRNNKLASIGCNAPWTKVNFSLIFDEQVINILPNDIEYKLIVHSRVYGHITQNKPEFKKHIHCVFDSAIVGESKYKQSSAHYAATYMIKTGYTKLNLYGIDAWFEPENWANSYTDQFIEKPKGIPINIGMHWKSEWQLMMKQFPKVEFNFI